MGSYFGSSLPACSATMYSAYQSAEFASDTGPPLVLAVRGFRTSHRSRQAGHRIEHRLVRVHTSK